MNPSILVTPNSKKAGKLDSIIPTDGTGDLDVVRATTATYVGSDGLIKTALANEPRFDYSNGSCPSILVEPQRTNLVLQSNTFNITWLLFSGASIISNSAISPEGIQNATTLNSSGAVDDFLYQSIPITNGVTYTNSFYIKNINSTSSKYRNVSNLDNIIIWSGATLVSISGTGTSSFVAVGNGWYRVSTTVASTSTSYIYRIFSDNANTSKSVYIYGAQLEAGSNATSYIPTTTSSVTRNADVIGKTGISSLIGQTEGTIYYNLSVNSINNASKYISLNDGTLNNRIIIGHDTGGSEFRLYYNSSGITSFTYTGSSWATGVVKKIAIVYATNNFKLFIDGVLVYTNNSITTFNSNNLTNFQITATVDFKINTIGLWKTALTNTQAIQLTTL